MKHICLWLLLTSCMLCTTVHAQTAPEARNPFNPETEKRDVARTIEGFWQDTARRILFARNAPPTYVFGKWVVLDQPDIYSLAKQIRKSGATFELIELQYEEEEFPIKVTTAGEDRIEFTRSSKWSACAMHHRCRLDDGELFCSLEQLCRERGQEVLDWQGEERYARRMHCAQLARRQGLGIPVRCQ
ncbi:MAG TPA: hypothetical protein VM656_07750 [Pyrinomonadaceae bacterium]|nr:hypothetical protein [Pyrinomonadaceae bacterium]